jgi:RNA polymerase sigma-70 factor (ECF subfamily)
MAWRDLYTAHAGRMLVWLRTLPSGDAGVAPEDLAADTWLTAATKIADFRGSSSDFAGWLFGIARLQARNASRRSGRRMTSPATSDTLDSTLTIYSPAAGNDPEAAAWITWLLSHLSERERQVVACIDVVGLDVTTTAAALQMTTTAVRVARHRGLRRLRALRSTVS